MKKKLSTRTVMSILCILSFVFLAACSAVNELLSNSIQKPTANVNNVRISGLSFDAVDLLFDINVNNPNSVGINLQGFDYDFTINNNSFLQGNNQDGLQIEGNGSSTVQIPLKVGFADLYRTFQSIKNLDSTGYELKTGFTFNLPVLGAVRVPVNKSGNIPLLKLPKINLSSLKLQKLSLTGADVELAVNLENSNGFPLNLDKLNYEFDVNGRKWGLGSVTQGMQLNSNGSSTLRIPLSLNFLEMGRSVYNLISGDNNLNYSLKGNANISSGMELLKALDLDFDKSGQVNLSR